MKPQSFGFCVIRRPLLSKNILEDFHALSNAEPAGFESELRRIFSDPILLEGLRLASGSLYDLAEDFVQGKTVSGKDKLLATLYKYLIRAASRCTPFGLFAGYFIAEASQNTLVDFCQQNPIKIRSLLDITAQQAIRAQILKKNNLRSQLLFYPNSSLYRAGQSYRYMKRVDQHQDTAFILTQVAFDPLLEKILNEVNAGILPTRIKSLLQSENLSPRGADAYTDALIGSQMLVSSIEVSVSGQDYLTYVKEKLSNLKNARALTGSVQRIQDQLALNASAKQINAVLKDLLKADHPLESTLQTTLSFQTTKASISQEVLAKLGCQLNGIRALCCRVQSQAMDDFISLFYERHAQQPVPLLLALDYDYGIGYAKLSKQTQPELPLLKGKRNGANRAKTPQTKTNDLAGALHQYVFENKNSTVLLTDELLKKYQNDPVAPELPPSFYVLGSLHAASEQALDAGDFLFELKGLLGPSAANLLARFCPGDPDLTSQVSQIIKKEQAQQDDVIFAEIAHVPTGKAANIVQRPDLGYYQIAYLARVGNKSEKTIRADDLWLSCKDGKNLILTSSKLNKRIIPILSSAHNFSVGLPVYRFLCDLANQHSKYLQWDWGAYAKAPFLPRVQYNQLILSKASWLLSYAAETTNPYQSKKDWWKAVEKKLNTPRYFTAGQGDQTLLIDSESECSLSLLSQMLKKEGSLRISESIEKPGQGILHEGGQYFSNEVLIPFFTQTHSTTQTKIVQMQPGAGRGNMTRRFTTVSAWLYVKIYCAESLSDLLITQTLAPLVASLQKRQIVKKWFFIRYQDPEPHLRIRFYSEKKEFWGLVLQELHILVEPLLESGMVRTIQTDSYQREFERYPSGLYDKIESFFHCDSQAVFSALSALPMDSDLRWQMALLGTDRLLNDFDLDVTERLILIEKMHRQFAAELDSDGMVRRSMDENYRSQRQRIAMILAPDKTPEIVKLTTFFKRRSIYLEGFNQKHALAESYLQTALYADLIHLFLNRWFYTQHRKQEFAIYHYLKKYYTSVTKNQNSDKIFL